jgi:hypothetical protein
LLVYFQGFFFVRPGVAAGVVGQGCRTMHSLLSIRPCAKGTESSQPAGPKQLAKICENISPEAAVFICDEVSMLQSEKLQDANQLFCDALNKQHLRCGHLPFAGFPIVLIIGAWRVCLC